jgi:hypothetical protein
MELFLHSGLANQYSSQAQKARVLTEYWVKTFAFCPNCGGDISQYQNNKPVADFFCPSCNEDYELIWLPLSTKRARFRLMSNNINCIEHLALVDTFRRGETVLWRRLLL